MTYEFIIMALIAMFTVLGNTSLRIRAGSKRRQAEGNMFGQIFTQLMPMITKNLSDQPTGNIDDLMGRKRQPVEPAPEPSSKTAA